MVGADAAYRKISDELDEELREPAKQYIKALCEATEEFKKKHSISQARQAAAGAAIRHCTAVLETMFDDPLAALEEVRDRVEANHD